jgi:hypothetical protein
MADASEATLPVSKWMPLTPDSIVSRKPPESLAITGIPRRRIAVDLVGGKVANIQAEEQVHGLNLQPVQKTRTGGASTAGTGRSNR